MTLRLPRILTPMVACAVFLASSPAWATWSTIEYRNSDGEYRYGIRDGSSRLKLGLKSRKEARKTARAMNKAEQADEAAAESEPKQEGESKK